MKKIKKILAANRSEIAIRIFRAAEESGIKTAAIYSKEDRFALHRFKTDESYLVGEGKGPIQAYLDINSIIDIAKKAGVDAIHPGYGFLSENPDLADQCEKNNIIFIGDSYTAGACVDAEFSIPYFFKNKFNPINLAWDGNNPSMYASLG